MGSLGDISEIALQLQTSAFKTVKMLHFAIFDHDVEPRQVRRRLRSFKGFQLDVNSPEFKKKLTELQTLGLIELTVLCHILNLEYSGDEETVAKRVCLFLNDLEKQPRSEDEEEDSETEFNDAEEGKEMTENYDKKTADSKYQHEDDDKEQTIRDMERRLKQIELQNVQPKNTATYEQRNEHREKPSH